MLFKNTLSNQYCLRKFAPLSFISGFIPALIIRIALGLNNPEEFSFSLDEDSSAAEQRIKTSAVVRDQKKLDAMKKKLHTDDELVWLNHDKSLREQGIDETQMLVLRLVSELQTPLCIYLHMCVLGKSSTFLIKMLTVMILCNSIYCFIKCVSVYVCVTVTPSVYMCVCMCDCDSLSVIVT